MVNLLKEVPHGKYTHWDAKSLSNLNPFNYAIIILKIPDSKSYEPTFYAFYIPNWMHSAKLYKCLLSTNKKNH